MDPKNINWPVAILLGVLGTVLITAITILSLQEKSTEVVLTVALIILGAAGFSIHGSVNQVKENSNGRMSQMQEQQAELITMVKDLALKVPPPVEPEDQRFP